MEKGVEQTQTKVWLAAGTSALLAIVAPENGIFVNLVLTVLAFFACSCVIRCCAGRKWGRWMYAVQYIWSLAAVVCILRYPPKIWGSNDDNISILLYLLALLGVRKGIGVGAAACSVLMWFFAALVGGVCLAAAENVKLVWVLENGRVFGAALIPVLLLPASLWILHCGEVKKSGMWLIPALAGAPVFCLIVRGSVSSVPEGVLGIVEMSRSVELLGKNMRFESLMALGLTLGIYCAVSVLTAVSKKCAEELGGRKNAVALVGQTLVILGLLCKLPITAEIAAIGALICWVILPLITQAVVPEKKL